MNWILEVPENGLRRSSFEVPVFEEELCLHHQLWVHSPLDLAVPILCWRGLTYGGGITAWPYPEPLAYWSFGSLVNLQFDDSAYSGSQVEVSLSGPNVIKLATVFEYVESSYDKDAVPRLVAAIPEHECAETLVPAVFGVSLAEFESDWREYIVEHYKINQ